MSGSGDSNLCWLSHLWQQSSMKYCPGGAVYWSLYVIDNTLYVDVQGLKLRELGD